MGPIWKNSCRMDSGIIRSPQMILFSTVVCQTDGFISTRGPRTTQDILRQFFKVLRENIEPGCLGQTELFGDSGWIRLFVHELFKHRSDIATMVFVDAGDYVFLEDVSLVLNQRQHFSASQLAASPRHGHMLPRVTFCLCDFLMLAFLVRQVT